MSKSTCRFCGKELRHTFADLGLSPFSNEYISEENLDCGQYFYPLVVKVCDECYMVQALAFRKPEEIFTNYKYFSSFSKSWLAHCKQYVDMVVPLLGLNKSSSVVEIACNDGYLLQYFKPYGITAYGIEPAANVADEARKLGIDVITDFFGEQMVSNLIDVRGRADLIIGNNVLAHVPDINDFVKGLSMLLSEKGVITMEFPHLLRLMQFNQFDTIYHEHFSYFSLGTVRHIFKAHSLKVINVDELDTHGGSIRIYAAHAENNDAIVDNSVERIVLSEKEYGLDTIETYLKFNDLITKIKVHSVNLLCEIKERGQKIAAFGAAAKGNTFLNYCGIGKDFIEYVADSNTHKQGSFLPGTRIPIVDKSVIFRDKPDYIVILPWNLRTEIANELKSTKEWNCKFITFIPNIEIF